MIDPRGLSFKDWADMTTPALAALGTIPVANDEKFWHHWAVAVIALPDIVQYVPPDPLLYSNWYEWAQRFVQAVPL